MTEEQKPERRPDDHTVYIGPKAFNGCQSRAIPRRVNYVTGVVMQFTTQNANEVVVKARGKFISRAVDVAEVASKRFLEGTIDVKNIAINSEEFQNKEGRTVRVSSIEITLGKK